MTDTTRRLAEAIAHHNAGRLDAADALYRQILALEPDHADALHLSGLVAFQKGDAAAALARIETAIERDPKVARYRANLGRVLMAAGRAQAAAEAYTRALALEADDARVLADRAAARLALEDARGAAADAGRAVALDAKLPEAHHNLALALQACGNARAAETGFRAALALKPDFADAHQCLAQILQERGALEEAAEHYRRALGLKPDRVEAQVNLGNVLGELGRLDAAIAAYQTALALQPERAEIHCNLGVARHERGDFAAALASFERALALKPDDPETHRNRALTLLLLGRYAEGWKDYEWRWQARSFRPLRRDFREPLWQGEPLLGRRILVHAEQGLGDTLQFARYLAPVAERGGRVAFECPPQLVDLLRHVKGAETVIAAGQPYPECEVRVPLLSLPRLFAPAAADVVPVRIPYLSADPERVLKWRQRLAGEVGAGALKIGVAWAGDPKHKNDRNRSLPIRRLLPLLAVPNIRFFSLQWGPRAADLEALPPGVLVDLSPEIGPFAEMAAAIVALDLVVTVDTAVAHLAGALGALTWVALPFVPDWRWRLEREDSPWYPTLRLFRQPKPGDWPSVVAVMAEALRLSL